MVKSLQVLRIHMLELEKVNELCNDFCTRYISCLKGKLNSENIMKTLEITTTPPGSPNHNTTTTTTTGPPVVTPASINEPKQLHRGEGGILNAETNGVEDDNDATEWKDIMEAVNGVPVTELTSGFLSKKKQMGKRGVLPKQATNVMKQWLFQHLIHPYPSEEEKKQLAEETNLSNLQVNNWFINARRRILQPMLETTTAFLKNNKKAKLDPGVEDEEGDGGVYGASGGGGGDGGGGGGGGVTMQQTLAGGSPSMGGPPSMAIVVSPTMVAPQSSAVILNLGDGQTQQVVLTQPLQFVQVSQIQTVAGTTSSAGTQRSQHGGARRSHSGARVATTTISTTQPSSIVVPLQR